MNQRWRNPWQCWQRDKPKLTFGGEAGRNQGMTDQEGRGRAGASQDNSEDREKAEPSGAENVEGWVTAVGLETRGKTRMMPDEDGARGARELVEWHLKETKMDFWAQRSKVELRNQST